MAILAEAIKLYRRFKDPRTRLNGRLKLNACGYVNSGRSHELSSLPPDSYLKPTTGNIVYVTRIWPRTFNVTSINHFCCFPRKQYRSCKIFDSLFSAALRRRSLPFCPTLDWFSAFLFLPNRKPVERETRQSLLIIIIIKRANNYHYLQRR